MGRAIRLLTLAIILLLSACTGIPHAREVFDIEDSVAVECSSVDDWVEEPSPAYALILGVVAVPGAESTSQAMQTANADGGLWESTKSGLIVPNGGKPFILSVPQDVQDRLYIWDWGTGGFKYEIRVPGCERSEDYVDDWVVFAGGLTVREPECVPLVVSDGSEEVRVMVGVGAPCPGQEPPPE